MKIPIKISTSKSIITRCLLCLLVGIMISYISFSAFAATGTKYEFTIGGKNYYNMSAISDAVTGRLNAQGHIYCTSSTVPAGYIGAMATMYQVTSSGSVFVGFCDWLYNDSAANGVVRSYYDNPPSGVYKSQGQSAVYYNGSYDTRYAHSSPNLNYK